MKKQTKKLIRIIIATSIFIIVLLTNLILKRVASLSLENGLASIINTEYGWVLPFLIYLAIYIYIGYDILRKCFLNIVHGQIFDENFLMVVATFGAFGLGIYTGIVSGVAEGFDEACAVLIFYQVGEWFQSFAVRKSRKSISELMNIRPDYANVKDENGEFIKVSPDQVKVGDIILVKAGEKIPLDGEVIEGSSLLDTKALTGESMPSEVKVGSSVLSGSININATLKIKVTCIYAKSTVSKILNLVQNESANKAKSEVFITKFSKYYTPIVVIMAVVLALLPPCIRLFMGLNGEFSNWIYRSLNFLVVSCPCALVVSVPLSLFVGLGKASKNGILIKGGVFLEQFNNANVFVFDKTGTLTKGQFSCSKFVPQDKKDELLHLAYICEKNSNHPIASAIINSYKGEENFGYLTEEISGYGIVAKGKDTILVGNAKLMENNGISVSKNDEVGTILYVAKDKTLVGYIVIEDTIKEDSYYIIDYLNSIGSKVVMLTGDNEKVAKFVAQKLNIKEYRSSLLPQNKVEEIDKLIQNKNNKDKICFVGDGINDAPVLTKANIGISMGGVGSDVAIEASDIVLMKDDLTKIKTAKSLANKTMQVVYQNIFFAIFVKVLILVLSSFGVVGLWASVIGDVGVAFIAILNSLRAGNIKDNKKIEKKQNGIESTKYL